MGQLPAFALERYFAKHEFAARHLLCCSDTEPLRLREALEEYADRESEALFWNLSLAYTECKGYGPLLRELASMYNSEGGCELDGDRHVQEVAPQEGILLGMLALVESGDRVVTTAPGYQSLHGVAASAGAEVALWRPIEDEAGGQRFSLETLRPLVTGNGGRPAKLLVVNFPHNPTGCLPSRAEWAEIVQLCRAHGTWLFADEMYRWLERSDEQRLAPAVSAYPERGVSLGGVSKSLGMPGARIGWLASADDGLMARIAELRDWTTICSSAPSQLLGLVAVRARRRLADRANAIVEAGRAHVAAAIESRPDLFAWGDGPAAGPIALVRLRPDAARAAAYCEALVQHSAILLLPSTVYDAGDRHFRIGFGRRNAPDVVRRWRATLDDPDHPATRLLLAS